VDVRHDTAASRFEADVDGGLARANGLRVMPACSYVRAYMRRHPDTQDLLADTAAA
jgi:predicted GNAT family acetyltransferase